MEKVFDLLGSDEDQKVNFGSLSSSTKCIRLVFMEKRKNKHIYVATAEAEREQYTWVRFKDALMEKEMEFINCPNSKG